MVPATLFLVKHGDWFRASALTCSPCYRVRVFRRNINLRKITTISNEVRNCLGPDCCACLGTVRWISSEAENRDFSSVESLQMRPEDVLG